MTAVQSSASERASKEIDPSSLLPREHPIPQHHHLIAIPFHPLLPLKHIINPPWVHGLIPIDDILNRLDTLAAGVEHLIPETGLFAVIRTLAPALTVVQVVVLGTEFGTDEVQEPGVC
jgi:hypothetical protein